MFGGTFDFSYPKSIFLTTDSIRYWASENAHIMDFFGGSGTTGNSVINLNREDQGNRKFTLVEMGDYFLSVLKPRVLKSFYSARWKDGVPQTIDKYISLLKKDLSFLNKELKAATADDSFTEYKATISFITSLIKQKESQIEIAKNENDSSNMFFSLPAFIKYQKLESYEDVLNNLNVISNKSNQDLLSNNQNLKEDYMLGYWLNVETADSSSLLNIDQFEDPFNYKLNIGTGSVGATKATIVDLMETFNYLIGLKIKTIDVLKGFKVVIGENPQDETVLIVWRNIKEENNDALEEFLDKQGYNPRDSEFDHIYVNGDHTLEDPRSIVKMIEIEFKRLMFDVEDV
jgi:adenine-specific DNA-methyltransferase